MSGSNSQIYVRDIMTKNVISIFTSTSLLEAAGLLSKNNFSGLPVVSDDGKIRGILTDYDLLTKGAKIHLPTFIKLLNEISIHKKDKSLIRQDLERIISLTAGDVMNDDPLILSENASLEEALFAFTEHHRVNPIPVADAANRLVGIISRYDIIKFYSPFQMKSADSLKYERSLDNKMNAFLDAFEKKFILVSRFRSRYWILVSLLFTIIGFFLALFLFGRIIVNY